MGISEMFYFDEFRVCVATLAKNFSRVFIIQLYLKFNIKYNLAN